MSTEKYMGVGLGGTVNISDEVSEKLISMWNLRA
jgi:hypothetical protein